MRKEFKKILAFILTSALLFTSILCFGVSAAAPKSLSVGLSADKTGYRAGDIVVLTVNASNFQNIVNGIYGFTMNLGYDSTKFDYIANSATLLNDTATGSLSESTQANNLTIVFFDNATTAPLGYMTAGNLVSVSFEVKENVTPTNYNFTLSSSEFADNEETIPVTVSYPSPLSVNVNASILGDVNGDGIVNLDDLVVVRDYLLGVGTISDPYKFAGDLYGEGNITLNDLVGIMAIISGS